MTVQIFVKEIIFRRVKTKFLLTRDFGDKERRTNAPTIICDFGDEVSRPNVSITKNHLREEERIFLPRHEDGHLVIETGSLRINISAFIAISLR